MEQEKNNSFLLVTLMVILVLLMCCAFVGMFFMLKEADDLNNKEEEIKEEIKCKSITGEYIAKVKEGKITYLFDNDGTLLIKDYNGDESSGTYTLNDGIVKIKEKDIDNTYSYTVSNDCEIINASKDDINYELKRVSK